MDWNDTVLSLVDVATAFGRWIVNVAEATGTWLASKDGTVLSEWLVALGTTGTVVFAVWSTLSERKQRDLLQEVDLIRAFDAALEKRGQLADQISFRIADKETSLSLPRRVFRRQGPSHSIVIHNPSPYPIHKVALIHRPPWVTPHDEYLTAFYSCESFWEIPVIPAGQSESFELGCVVIGDRAEIFLRFETANATCWARSEDGYTMLLSDSSLLGVTAEQMIRNMLERPTSTRKRKRQRDAVLARLRNSGSRQERLRFESLRNYLTRWKPRKSVGGQRSRPL